MLSVREHSTGREVATADDIDGARLAVRTIEREVATQGYRLDVFHVADEPTVERINGCDVIMVVNGCSIIDHPNCGFMVYSNGPRVGTYKTLAGAVRRAERQPAPAYIEGATP